MNESCDGLRRNCLGEHADSGDPCGSGIPASVHTRRRNAAEGEYGYLACCGAGLLQRMQTEAGAHLLPGDTLFEDWAKEDEVYFPRTCMFDFIKRVAGDADEWSFPTRE